MQITIPRWAQLVLVPLAVIVLLYLLRFVSHALFVFTMASLLALLLNPIVDSLQRLFVPRAVSVPLVYLTFTALLVLLLLVGVPPILEQGQRLIDRTPEWSAVIEGGLRDFEAYLERRGIAMNLEGAVDRALLFIESRTLTTAGTVFNFTIDIVGSLFSFLLVVIISFYMLIDGRRIHSYLGRMVPGDDETAEAYLGGLQQSFTRYVKGQALLASSVGLAAGFGIWVLGWDVVSVWPEGSQYALLFGVWAGVTEVIPYIGPWLGAAPPVLLALFHSPTAALWVALVYFVVQQLENHILVPNILGTSVGVHPLVVIFALLAGAQVGGIVGMLAVLPLLAMLKHTLDFYDLRFSRAAWIADDGIALPAPPEIEARRRPLPAEGRPAPAKPVDGAGGGDGSTEDKAEAGLGKP